MIKEFLRRVIRTCTTPKMRETVKRELFQLAWRSRDHGALFSNPCPFGINLIGPIRGDFGLGESCRLVANALKESELPFSIYNLSNSGAAKETNTTWSQYENETLPYGINLVHVNPAGLVRALVRFDRRALQDRYNIAYWLWELPEFPREWDYAFAPFDEIWTPSEFISASLRKNTDKPVRTIPYGLAMPKTESCCGRDYFALPANHFLFMLSYDSFSVSERKNPLGAIRAYKKAFPVEDPRAGLVIKVTHAERQEMAAIMSQLRKYENVFVLTDSYPKEVFNSLVKCADVYVSLHRAEGFGLVMAEAMLLGTPVVATAWSANTEFMNEDVACMVRADIVPLDKEYPPYHKGSHWANPDEDHAAALMKRLFIDKAFREDKAKKAREHILGKMSPQNAATRIKARLEELRY